MKQIILRGGTRALAIIGLSAALSACNDAPSEPRKSLNVPRPDKTAESPAGRSAPEILDLQSQTMIGAGLEERANHRVTTARGIASLDASFFGREASDVAPVPLRVWDAGTRGVARVRQSRMAIRLPDHGVAFVEREFSPDGAPMTMRVRVGDREFVWRRSWVGRNGIQTLQSVEVESRLGGRLVARSRINITARRVAALRARQAARSSAQLRAMSRRFGSLAGTVLLPRLLQAQTDGMACNGAATALKAAWVGWRISTVLWSVSMAVGGFAKATAAELTASAAVDVAEANYIDCYVAAAAAGVPDSRIAPPPEADEL